MQFTTHRDINAPIDYVYRRVSNFDAYERQALRQGAQVVRVDGAGPVTVGAAWDVAFTFRNKDRKLRATIATLDTPNRILVQTVATGLTSVTDVSLVALSPQITRVNVTIDMAAKSLSARLLLQSLKLAKSNLHKRFVKRVKDQLSALEVDFQRGR